MNYGFVNVAAAVPSVRVADVRYNVAEIEKQLVKAEADGVEVVVFPELSMTGYSCQDLFAQQRLISVAEEGMALLLNQSREMDVIGIVGAPVAYHNMLLNCGIVF